MYIHLGEGTMLRSEEIIGIFDIERTTATQTNRKFLAASQKNGNITNVGSDIPKSFVVCCSQGRQRTYITKVSPLTLKKRCDLKIKDMLKTE